MRLHSRRTGIPGQRRCLGHLLSPLRLEIARLVPLIPPTLSCNPDGAHYGSEGEHTTHSGGGSAARVHRAIAATWGFWSRGPIDDSKADRFHDKGRHGRFSRRGRGPAGCGRVDETRLC